MNVVSLSGDNRTDFGKKANKALRRKGLVPCVIYGGKRDKNIHFYAKEIVFKSLIYTHEFKLAEITVDGKTYKCFLKDKQFHPVTDKLVHADFIELVPNYPINVEIPIHFEGTPQGVTDGGVFIQNLRRLKVLTTPEHLTDHLVLNVAELKLGGVARIRDIIKIEGLEIQTNLSTPVASIKVPRTVKTAEEGEGAEGEASETEAATEAEA